MAFRAALRLQRRHLTPTIRPTPFRCLAHPHPFQQRCFSEATDPAAAAAAAAPPVEAPPPAVKLNPNAKPSYVAPELCPGCGAPGQQVDETLPGFYPRKITNRLKPAPPEPKHRKGIPRKLERKRRDQQKCLN